jgi:hypothetical protein
MAPERRVIEEELRRQGHSAAGGRDARCVVFAFGDGDCDVPGSSQDVSDPVTVWDWSLLRIVRRLGVII